MSHNDPCSQCLGTQGTAVLDDWTGQTVMYPCIACDGTGRADHEIQACERCGGSGEFSLFDTSGRTCSDCQGSGVQ